MVQKDYDNVPLAHSYTFLNIAHYFSIWVIGLVLFMFLYIVSYLLSHVDIEAKTSLELP